MSHEKSEQANTENLSPEAKQIFQAIATKILEDPEFKKQVDDLLDQDPGSPGGPAEKGLIAYIQSHHPEEHHEGQVARELIPELRRLEGKSAGDLVDMERVSRRFRGGGGS